MLMYAKITQPLYDLTRQGTPFNWTASCEQAFDTLKSKLLTAPILAYPDFTRDFVLLKGSTEPLKQCSGSRQPCRHGAQWDQYIHGVVWAYHNTPHS